MLILGIDPGSTRAGYGLIKIQRDGIELLKSGILKVDAKDKNKRLLDLANSYEKLLKKEKPDLVAIEKLYFMKNVKTGMEVAQSRGVLSVITLQNKIELVELAPTEVKLNIAGAGNADKKAVAKMVCRILGVDKISAKSGSASGGKVLDDVTDAVAIAIVAGNLINFRRRFENK